MDIDDVSVTYESTLSSVKHEQQKMEVTKADGTTKVKLEFPIYDSQENMELLVKLLMRFRKTVVNYYLFTLLGEAEVYDNFKQCLQ